MPEEAATLAEECSVYDRMLPKWREREGQFVLISDSQVVGFFDEYVQAVRAGYQQFGIAPFLVEQVRSPRQAHTVTRLSAPQLSR